MAEIVKFVYVMIIFVSPFLFLINLDGKPLFYPFQIFFFTF